MSLSETGVIVVLKHENRFEEFWNLYPTPRRTGKVIAKSKWDAIVGPTGLCTRAKDTSSDTYITLTLSATPEEIIAGLKRAREQWKGTGNNSYGWKDEGKFIPLPSTWLNRGGWAD